MMFEVKLANWFTRRQRQSFRIFASRILKKTLTKFSNVHFCKTLKLHLRLHDKTGVNTWSHHCFIRFHDNNIGKIFSAILKPLRSGPLTHFCLSHPLTNQKFYLTRNKFCVSRHDFSGKVRGITLQTYTRKNNYQVSQWTNKFVFDRST